MLKALLNTLLMLRFETEKLINNSHYQLRSFRYTINKGANHEKAHNTTCTI